MTAPCGAPAKGLISSQLAFKKTVPSRNETMFIYMAFSAKSDFIGKSDIIGCVEGV